MPLRVTLGAGLLVVLAASVVSGDDPDPAAPVERTRVEALEREVDRLVAAGADEAHAVEMAREAVRLRERLDGPTSSAVGGALRRLARALGEARQHEEVVPTLERALALLERTPGSAAEVLGRTRVDLGAALRGGPRWPEGQRLLDDGVALLERTLGPRHAGTLEARVVRADARRVTSAFDAAVAELKEVERHLAEGPAGGELDVASLRMQWAHVAFELGRVEEAREAYELALDARERLLAADDPLVAASLLSLGAMYGTLGQLSRARPLYVRAIEILERGPVGHMLALACNNHGANLLLLGEAAAAADTLRKSLALRERLVGADGSEAAFTLCLLGRALLALGDLAEARAVSERALAVHARSDTGDWQRYLSSSLAARVALADGDFARGLAHAVTAREGYERTLPVARRERAESLALEAELRTLLGQGSLAWPLFQQALDLTEETARRALPANQGGQRVARLRTLRTVLDAYLRSAPALGRTGYEEVLRFKGLVARAEAADRRLEREAGPDAAGAVGSLRAIEQRLAAKANERVPRTPAEGYARWQAEYAALSVERDRLRSELGRRLAGFGRTLDRLGLGLADVQRALEPGAVLVDTLRVGGAYLAWVVRREGSPTRLELGGARALEEAAQALRAAAATEEVARADEHVAAARTLAELVWKPLEPQLGADAQRIYVSPDADLASVPLGLLPRGDRPALDRGSVSLVAMAQDLVARPEVAGRGALLVGGVDFDRAGAPATTGPRAALREADARRAARLGPGARRPFRPLPGTEVEIGSLQGLWGAEAAVLSGAAATERAVREGAAGRAALHLATHGFVRADRGLGAASGSSPRRWLGGRGESQLVGEDPMVLAGLALAGANPRAGGGDDDGLLTALEVTYLDLRGCRRVVLSACQTALGEAAPGEGVLGLVQGFQIAGAKDVVASLWEVDDAATRLLMERFYALTQRTAEPVSTAEALRQAALWLRDARPGGVDYAHPRTWAAFVVYEAR